MAEGVVRSLFASASLEDAVRPPETAVSSNARAEAGPDPAAAFPYTPGWNPGALRAEPAHPQMTLHTTAPVVDTTAPVAILPPPPPPLAEPAPDSRMVGFAPRPAKPRPLSGRAFTNNDR